VRSTLGRTLPGAEGRQYARHVPTRLSAAGGTVTWRRGIAALLGEAGFEIVECPDLDDWKPGLGGVAVVSWAAADSGFEDVSRFVDEHPHIPVVVVTPSVDLVRVAEAIRSGAAGVVDEADDLGAMTAAVAAAIDGRICLPRPLVSSMAARIPSTPDPSAWLGEVECDWLRALAEGTTVAELAERIGYSEREMFRMLGTLYEKIGARNRTESIIWATRHGLLDET
jgi:DNA-binding NarL/FixJ family response regulator